MAKKRRKKTARKTAKRRFMSAPRRKVSRARRRVKRGLSELMTPAGAMSAIKGAGLGAVGGFGAGVIDNMTSSLPKLGRVAVALGSSVLTHALVNEKIGAGMAGGFAYGMTQNLRAQFMSEDDIYADPDALNQLPPVLNENGEELTLMEDETGLYLLDESTGETYLAEEIYPQYAVNY